MQSFTCHTNEDAGRIAAETASLLKLLPPGVEVAPGDLADLAAAIRPDGPRFLIFQGPTYSAETLAKAVLCKRLGVSFEEIASAAPHLYPIEARLAIIDRGFGFFTDPTVLESAELVRLGVRETILNPKFGIPGSGHAAARDFDCSRVVIVATVPEAYRWDRLDCHPDLAEWLPVVRVIRLVREGAARNLGELPSRPAEPGERFLCEEPAARYGLPLLAGMTLCKEPRDGGRPFWVLRGGDDGEAILRIPGEFSERHAAEAASVSLEYGNNQRLLGYGQGRAAERAAITYGFKAVFGALAPGGK